MKVTVKQQPEEFKPVTLEITFTTRNEFIAFKGLCGSDGSATEAASIEDHLRPTAKNILGAIFYELQALKIK